jgi:hypothetical protein
VMWEGGGVSERPAEARKRRVWRHSATGGAGEENAGPWADSEK